VGHHRENVPKKMAPALLLLLLFGNQEIHGKILMKTHGEAGNLPETKTFAGRF
jgi:hypothetical protein